MDDINEILKTDLLKRYVIGTVSPEEKMKVDLLLIDHPAVRRALRKLEIEIEQKALANQVSPPSHIKKAIVKQLHPDYISKTPTPSGGKGFKILSYAATFLIGGLLMWVGMQPNQQRLSTELESTEQELTKLMADCNELSDIYAFINDGATKPMLLDGDSFKKNAEVIVYWNEERSKAMLRVVNLPALSDNHTYQLWADVDGEMLDLGVFDAAMAIVDPINIGYLDAATSLNITVEPNGGSEHPTVSTLTANKII